MAWIIRRSCMPQWMRRSGRVCRSGQSMLADWWHRLRWETRRRVRPEIWRVYGGGQGAAARGRVDVGRPYDGADDCDGDQLLPTQSRGVFCADDGEDSGA